MKTRDKILLIGILALACSFAAILLLVVGFVQLPAEWIFALCLLPIVGTLIFGGALAYYATSKAME
jgi:hypothetical protein